MNAYPKKLEGLCIGVLSGDRILFQGPPDRENGGFKQKILYLSGIQAPKFDQVNAREEKYGFAARQFMRKRLVGRKLTFVVEKKINEMEVGHVLDDNKDVTTDLLAEGLAKIRGDKTGAEHIDDYKDAEEDAKVSALGIWNEDADQKAFRELSKKTTEADLIKLYKGKTFTAIVEQVHPSKAVLYVPKENILATLVFSEVQAVVLSEKLSSTSIIYSDGESKNNVRAIRSVLESSFLQREVEVSLSAHSKDELLGFITSKNGEDARKILLQNGFAKLSKDAMETAGAKEFLELKSIAQQALEGGQGLWKDQKITKTSTSNNSKQFTATVVEVHSGDSVSVLPEGRKDAIRVFLPHTRAPAVDKPFYFESKQTLRRRCIGRKVKVEIEFVKKIPVKKLDGTGEQIKDFTYASIFENNTLLGAYMLEQGLVSIQQIRTEEDVSKYLEQLKDAEQKGKKERKGLNSNHQAKIPTYNDVSGGKGKKIDASKAKNLFAYLQGEPHLTGVIEIVLNGSRFKIRFNEHHVMAIVVLDGVRCLSNEGQFVKISEESLNFSKANALQRDCDIKIKRVDLKGVYHAEIFINKKDWAAELLERGLAVTAQRNNNEYYEQLEKKARSGKVGLWKFDFNLSSIKGQTEKEFKPVNFTKTLILVEVPNANQFYLESEGCKKPEVPQKPSMASNVKVGEVYLAQFSDDVYYRAKILKQTKTGYDVHFIDYGNYDHVPKGKIGAIEESLRKIKSPLFKASLFGLQGLTKEAFNILTDNIGRKLKTEIREQSEDGESRVIIWDKDLCINLDLLQLGEAQNTSSNVEWANAQESARKNREGKWANE